MNAWEKAIYDYHNTNKTIALILQETGISKSMFYRNLDYKEEFREKKKARKYTFNFDKFKQDTADKFYWLGFLGADGCVVGNTLSIELKENDVEHLEKFNAFCENTKSITKRINNLNVACVKTQINSYELIDYLKQYNIYQNKSKTYVIPVEQIPQEFLMDFIRGLIDGDGCVHKDGRVSIYSGSYSYIKSVQETLIQEIGISRLKIYHGTTYFVSWSSKEDKNKLFNYLYNDLSQAFYYKRKYNRLHDNL